MTGERAPESCFILLIVRFNVESTTKRLNTDTNFQQLFVFLFSNLACAHAHLFENLALEKKPQRKVGLSNIVQHFAFEWRATRVSWYVHCKDAR